MFLLLCPFAELSLIVHIIIYRIFLVRFLRVQDYKKKQNKSLQNMVGFEISYYFCNEKVTNPMVTRMLICRMLCSRKFLVWKVKQSMNVDWREDDFWMNSMLNQILWKGWARHIILVTLIICSISSIQRYRRSRWMPDALVLIETVR